MLCGETFSADAGKSSSIGWRTLRGRQGTVVQDTVGGQYPGGVSGIRPGEALQPDIKHIPMLNVSRKFRKDQEIRIRQRLQCRAGKKPLDETRKPFPNRKPRRKACHAGSPACNLETCTYQQRGHGHIHFHPKAAVKGDTEMVIFIEIEPGEAIGNSG